MEISLDRSWKERDAADRDRISHCVLVRASVGSSIVAMTMASGIMASMPAMADSSTLYRAAMCCAICGGATALSHVNDAGFWLEVHFFGD